MLCFTPTVLIVRSGSRLASPLKWSLLTRCGPPALAMTEMISLFIALLTGMMIVPCRRAFVLQCSSLPSMAYLRLPLVCPILLTVVLAPLANAWTFSNLPVQIVPPVTSLPLAPRSGTPCAMHVCKLPSMTIQGGAVHVLKPNGTSTCSLGESLDLAGARRRPRGAAGRARVG